MRKVTFAAMDKKGNIKNRIVEVTEADDTALRTRAFALNWVIENVEIVEVVA